MLPNAQKSVADTAQATAVARLVCHKYHLLAYCCRMNLGLEGRQCSEFGRSRQAALRLLSSTPFSSRTNVRSDERARLIPSQNVFNGYVKEPVRVTAIMLIYL